MISKKEKTQHRQQLAGLTNRGILLECFCIDLTSMHGVVIWFHFYMVGGWL